MASANPPVALTRPYEVATPNGSKRSDPYAWLRDDDGKDPEVIKYLEAENEYGKGVVEANSELAKRILYDMDSRVPRLEATPATPSDSLSYWYGSTRGPGQDYWVHSRRPGLTKLQGHGTGPLSYGPDLKVSEQVVLDINALADRFPKYCDVASVKPSPDGRFVAFTVDTVGNEEYTLVVQEIGSGRRAPFAGAEAPSTSSPDDLGGMRNVGPTVEWAADSAAVFALQLTPKTHEAYKLVRCRLLPSPSLSPPAATSSGGGSKAPEPELLLQDDTPGAVLEMAGRTSCGRFLMLSRKAEGYTALLALTLPAGRSGGAAPQPSATAATPPSAKQPLRGVPNGVKLFGTDPWVVVAPESAACDVLRAVHLYGNGDGRSTTETFAVLLDSDKYPDGCVCAVTGGDLKRRTVLVPGQKGRQIVDIAVRGDCGAAVASNGAHSNGAAAANGSHAAASNGGGTATKSATGQYLVVHVLEDMKASVQVYDISNLKQVLAAHVAARAQRGRQRRTALRKAAPTAGADKNGDAPNDNDDDDDDDDGESADEQEASKAVVTAAAAATGAQQPEVLQARAAPGGKAKAPPASGTGGLLLPSVWSYFPGDAISSLHLDHGCWAGSGSGSQPLPYVRISYSNLTTPTTTVDLDLAAKKAYKREVERVEHYVEGRYMSATLWATSDDGAAVPATVACRTDAWPPTTGRPLPCILQAYGAYGRKLLPDFIPGDLAMLDGGAGEAAAAVAATEGTGGAAAADAGGCGPCLVVLAHVRGGGELGSHWHVEGKKHNKINTQLDIAAVVRMLLERGFARHEAVALWGRSAGGLAMGMTLERCPPGTFRTAVLDVPFLDVLGSMTDPSLPLTIKERPEWGDPASSQEDYDYILSYSPYDNVESLATATPALVVTCSLHDPRVPYWGPAKFVARLRAAMAAKAKAQAGGGAVAASGQGGGPVVLLTELEAGGHFSVSGASGRLAERAMRVAFMMRQLRAGMEQAEAAGAAKGKAESLRPAQRPE